MISNKISFSYYQYAPVNSFGVSVGIASSAVGLKTRLLTTEIKKYASIFKKKKKKHDEIVLLAKTKLNAIAVLISKAYRNNSR